jgi:abortive infection bacteriophage resistance protein
MAKRHYTKMPLSFSCQLALLEERGLTVEDRSAAIAFLEYANYYRFSAYCLPFEAGRHAFLPGTTFEQIKALYEFDRTLRDLLAQGLEVAEIHFRTRIAMLWRINTGSLHMSTGLCSLAGSIGKNGMGGL